MKTISFAKFRTALIVWVLALQLPAMAHHGISAQFDTSSSIEISGEITGVVWRNPHVLFTVDVTADDGRQVQWTAETLSTGMMRKNAIPAALFQAGDQVRIAGLPSVRGMNEIYPTNLLLADGREIVFNARVEPLWTDSLVGRSGPNHVREGDPSAPELGIFRVWSSTATTPGYFANLNLDSNPLGVPTPTLSAGIRPNQGTAATQCAPKGLPSAMAQPYPMEFVQDGDTILLRIEEYDAVRTIHILPGEAVQGPEPTLMGYSTGFWEGATLVVTTKHLRNARMGGGVRISDAAELVERFTPSADGSRLDYNITVTDPGLAEPVVLDKYWLYVPNVTMEPYDCVPGSGSTGAVLGR